MRDLDVGAIPVTSDGKPVGMLTDRDIAIRAVAEGRDLSSTTVADVMTKETVFCQPGESIQDAADVMQARQVRRLLVVDDDGRLAGIVSLGDLSIRTADDDLSEETLEDVSWPGHPQGRGFTDYASYTGRRARGAMSHEGTGTMTGLLAGLALGAGLMYLFDTNSGRGRRAYLRDKAYSSGRELGDRGSKSARYARDKARGAMHEARKAATSDNPDDHTLEARVRSEMGRAVSHPGSITVDALDGVVTLSGPVLRDEVDRLISAVKSVRGVRDVRNLLDVHETAGNVPGLQ